LALQSGGSDDAGNYRTNGDCLDGSISH
jgi:hypothetical protein